ncbi:F0F1 ATP synthase subunit A [Desulfofalx alkaliphila]|uniref:F0F1 ATP synthase subunit A n=1 Tax=Desulfofalx alkaliphila TaxID=105483 RepID=UPI0004E19B48|nr:F0F1 ATP synthase subunit A [Desulfofalx alkaliphila]
MKSPDEVKKELLCGWERVLGDMWYGPTNFGTINGIPIEINVLTVVMTWITMAIVALVGYLAVKNLSIDKPGRLQVTFETVYTFLRDIIFDNITSQKRATSVMPIVLSLFVFIWFANMLGMIPMMDSPTGDVNTTIGLALMVFIGIQVLGIKDKGLSYFKHYVEPYPFFLPLVIVEEIAKPVTLGFRLFGNIFAKKMFTLVLLGMIPITANFMGGFIPHVIWLAFGIFVGTIQAFIFSMLTIVYTAQAVNKHH